MISSQTVSGIWTVENTTVNRTILLDHDGVTISVESFDPQGRDGPELELLIQNDSDNIVTARAFGVSVNGYAITCDHRPRSGPNVAKGETGRICVVFDSLDLELAGIRSFEEIELRLHTFDQDSGKVLFCSDPVKIETSAHEGADPGVSDSGDVIWSEKGVTISGLGFLDDGEKGGLLVEIVNHSGKGIEVHAGDASIDGEAYGCVFSSLIPDGKRAIRVLSFRESSTQPPEDPDHYTLQLRLPDYRSVRTIKLSFTVMELDGDGWITEKTLVQSGPVTIAFD